MRSCWGAGCQAAAAAPTRATCAMPPGIAQLPAPCVSCRAPPQPRGLRFLVPELRDWAIRCRSRDAASSGARPTALTASARHGCIRGRQRAVARARERQRQRWARPTTLSVLCACICMERDAPSQWLLPPSPSLPGQAARKGDGDGPTPKKQKTAGGWVSSHRCRPKSTAAHPPAAHPPPCHAAAGPHQRVPSTAGADVAARPPGVAAAGHARQQTMLTWTSCRRWSMVRWCCSPPPAGAPAMAGAHAAHNAACSRPAARGGMTVA